MKILKKALAISLLVICNTAAIFALSAVSLYIIVMLAADALIFSLVFTILIGLAAVIALGFASRRVFFVFERKYSLKTRRFVLASHVSPIIGAAVYWIVYLSLDAAGRFTGYPGGIPELLYAVLLSVTAVAYYIAGWTWSSTVKDIDTRG